MNAECSCCLRFVVERRRQMMIFELYLQYSAFDIRSEPGKDVKILPLSTNFYVEPTARQNFNVVSSRVIGHWCIAFCKGKSVALYIEDRRSRTQNAELEFRLSNFK
jgi:hypothetical protein